MSKKKIWLSVMIVMVMVASIVGVTYAAWVEFTSKPTGNWEISAVVPKDITITNTVADTSAVYMGHNGSAGEIFISTATVTMKSTKNMTIVGTAVVKCMKGTEDITIAEDKIFKVVFFAADTQIDSFDLTAYTSADIKIGVIFPDLSDTKYQKSTFTIKVNISEKVAA